ncbi:MAG: methyltransferase [Pseudomonadota bacterium]
MHENEYTDAFVAKLELLWGEGFLSPGGPAETAKILEGTDLTGLEVMDIGCGIGLWRHVIARHFPKARYHGVEVSEYLCDTYNWQFGSVVDFRPRRMFDFVICKDVVQYLPAREAATAGSRSSRLPAHHIARATAATTSATQPQ